MEHCWNTPGTLLGHPGTQMEHPWNTAGTSMEHLGTQLEHPWNTAGTLRGHYNRRAGLAFVLEPTLRKLNEATITIEVK